MSIGGDDHLSRQLLELGMVTEGDLAEAKQMQTQMGTQLGTALIQLGVLTAADLARLAPGEAQAEQPAGEARAQAAAPAAPAAPTAQRASLANYEIDPAAIREVPRQVAEQHLVLPIQMSEDRVVVAMADATNVFAIDEVRQRTGRRVEPIEVDEAELQAAIEQFYSAQVRAALASTEGAIDPSQPLLHPELMEGVEDDLVQMLDQAPVVRVVESILRNAVRARASDVHVEPREDGVYVRYRVDGQLMTVMTLDREMQKLVASRLKIMSEIDIAETRLPHDGRAFVTVDDRPIDLRVSTLPTYFGEKVVLRLLDKSQVLISLKQLGFLPETLAAYEELLQTPQGMILVTGPTGSGKSTTLYASLQQLKTETKNIVTVEDPIEYQVEGINQSQVHPRIDLTFARALRSILRQDPDIILVGEIRDLETAEMAFRAALTGHLVLSTLHTNDAPSAATRLVDMHVEPYLIASSVVGVLAQRLVRRICTRCREQTQPTELEVEQLALRSEELADMSFFKGRGCEQCRNTGYYGRVGVYELMHMNNEIREAVTAGKSAAEIRSIAIESGMHTLRDDGLQKVNSGVTTAQEVINVIFSVEEAA
ncbi:MAG: GspE/PulE family protein [Armatimonadota bacterium]